MKKNEYRKIVFDILNFKPKIHSTDFEYYLHELEENQIENDKIYSLVEKLTNLAYPSQEDQYDKRWEYFYIPIKRGNKTIAIPIWIMEYHNEFYLSIHSFGNLHIQKGTKKVEKIYLDIIKEILRFLPILQSDDRILQKIIPYDVRTGKIKGRYVMEKLLSRCRKRLILNNYKKHLEKNLHIKEISLNEYLEVAAICYKSAYKKETENFSNIDMYKRWADGRDGGMLSIKDYNSKKEFAEWNESGIHIGSHPFEIVFSWHQHGIHLYPPYSSNCFAIRITNYAYGWIFLKMVNGLIKMEIPFEAREFETLVDFLAGDTFFAVNKREEHSFNYYVNKEYKKKYFPHIIWDDIKVLKWK